MNIVTLVNGIKTLANKLPFVNFTSGSFIARLDSDLLTADRNQKLPDKDGTIALTDDTQPQSTTLTAIAGLNTTGLIDRTGVGTSVTRSVGATGLQSIAASTQLDGRNAIGLGTIATNSTKNTWFTNNFFANADNSPSLSGGYDPIVNRFANCTNFATITSNPPVDVTGMFDVSTDSVCDMTSTSPTVVVIDYMMDGQASNDPYGFAYVYTSGTMCFSYYDFYPAGYLTPLSIKVDFFQQIYASDAGEWINLAMVYPQDNSAITLNKPDIIAIPEQYYIRKLRLTFTPRPGALHTAISSAKYFPSRPDQAELPQFIMSSASELQSLYGDLQISKNKISPKLTISNGAIKLEPMQSSSAENNSLFLNQDSLKLSFKDSSGNSHTLY